MTGAGKERTALITGAAGGIGVALCAMFQGAGYRVVGTDQKKAEGCDAFVTADLGALCQSESGRRELLDRFRAAIGPGGLATLVNNAAVQRLGSTESATVDDWRATLETNILAPFLLTQGLLTELERARGSVINIASVHANLTKAGFVAYATSKAALVGLTRSMAVDLGGRVRVNAVLPAATDTPMLRASFEGNPAGLSALAAMHPLGRVAQPEEVAAVAIFLASDAAGFITGAAVPVDGGIGARLHDPA